MAATTASSGSCTAFTAVVLPLSPPPFCKHVIYSRRRRVSSLVFTRRQVSHSISTPSPESAVVDDDESGGSGTDGEMPLDAPEDSLLPVTGCKACGNLEIQKGCNGEGRIQGGIATVPGFGWWPIKAYRPCPAYLAAGGRYRRSGQSMDEVVSGRS